MAARGLLDYLRAVGVLVRGIIVNFLIFLPYLLIVAIVLAYAHHWMLANPFRLTLGAFALAVAWTLIFPVMMPLIKIATHTRSVETGSESSVMQRDLYERSFGALLVAILAVAALESLPWALEYLHEAIQLGQFHWQGRTGDGSHRTGRVQQRRQVVVGPQWREEDVGDGADRRPGAARATDR